MVQGSALLPLVRVVGVHVLDQDVPSYLGILVVAGLYEVPGATATRKLVLVAVASRPRKSRRRWRYFSAPAFPG